MPNLRIEMKSITTLRDDIYSLFDQDTNVEVNPEHLSIFSKNVTDKIQEALKKPTRKPELRMSNLGTPCAKQLWYSVNKPELGEKLTPKTYIKFLFGNIIEELVLLFAKTSGHEVSNEQKVLDINGVRGQCDATIDGVLVDVKSASSRSFDKFEKGLTKEDDGFGYLTQLGLYNHSIGNSGKAGAFVAFDKQMGDIAVDVHNDLSNTDYVKLVEERKSVVAAPEPPPRGFTDKPEGASGNRALGVNCSYCPFKKSCWSGLRTFLYYKGPVHFTHVSRLPDVKEIT